MNDLRSYLLSVCVSALICATIPILIGEKSGSGKMIKLLSGIYMAIVILNPVLNLDRLNWKQVELYLHEESDAAVTAGKKMAMDEMINIKAVKLII